MTTPNCFRCRRSDRIVRNGTYATRTKGLVQRFLCKKCGKGWSEHHKSFFFNLRTPENDVLESLAYACAARRKGKTVGCISRNSDIKWDTLNRWLNRVESYPEVKKRLIQRSKKKEIVKYVEDWE